MSDDIQAVVFDLADVLFEFAGPESLAQVSGGRVGPAAFNRLWASQLADTFYCGGCSPEDFAVGAVAQLGLPVSPTKFLEAFAAWFQGPFPGALELVEDVRSRAVVACLSNTNSLDVVRFRSEVHIDRRFDACFFSNEIRLRKPDRACYLHVLERLGHAHHPERVLFLDDSSANVEAAREVGLRAAQVRGITNVRSCLSSLGLISSSSALGA